jgi:LPS sulfotransferase NodH
LSDSAPAQTRFVILAAPRTGSNWLCSLLNSHSDILCHHEVFNPNGIFYALDFRDGTLDLGTIDERNRQPLEFLNRIWRHPLGSTCIGFKMTRGQDERVLQAVLDDRAVRKIVLRRRNVLRTYVSEKIAEQTGRWEAYESSELKEKPSRVCVKIEDLRDHVRLNDAFYDRLEQTLWLSGQRCMAVWYEQLFAIDAHSWLLKFLDVSPANLIAKSVKQNPDDLTQLISNYHEFESAVAGTEFGPFVENEEVCAYGRELSGNA